MLEIEDCDPRSEETTARLIMGSDGNVDYDCVTLNNGNSCKEATCYIEAWFTKLIIAQSLQYLSLPDFDNLKVENGFDQTSCNTSTEKSRVPEKFCCGTHVHNTKRLLRS